jgi:hypothetical protein
MINGIAVVLLAGAMAAPALAAAQGSGPAPITQVQAARIDAALQLQGPETALTKAVAEARGTIAEFLKIHSCITYNASSLNAFAAPGKHYPDNNYTQSPKPRMYRHNKGSCVTVQRVYGWTMPTPNALRFEVVYISDTSGESGKSVHEMQKQPNGEWLFSR